MTRLLIFEPSFRRIEGELATLGGVEPLVMDREGKITLAGATVEGDDARPEMVWFSGELYQQSAMGAFIRATLASPELKWFQSAAAGFDNPLFARIVAKGARLTTSHGQAVGMADVGSPGTELEFAL